MTHQRARSCESILTKDLRHTPCISLVGMRQVGKTTLLKKYTEHYVSFDDPQVIADFDRSGNALLKKNKGALGLDEVQKYPPIFDLIKLNVDNIKKPGQFLITGSVRFSQRRQIRESLTGRNITIEVFPFTIAECHSKPESVFLKCVLENNSERIISELKKKEWVSENEIENYMSTGGLPGICFRRDAGVRARYFQSHLDALLGRDIHLIRETRATPQKILALLTEVAKNQGQKISMANYARVIGLSQPTVTTLMQALEALFLIKPFGHTHIIEDAGISHFLAPQQKTTGLWDRIRMLYYHLRVQQMCQFPGVLKMAPFSTRGGMFIPFMIEHHLGKKIALFVDDEEVPSDKNILAASLIRKKHPDIISIILVSGNKAYETAKKTICIPWQWVF